MTGGEEEKESTDGLTGRALAVIARVPGCKQTGMGVNLKGKKTDYLRGSCGPSRCGTWVTQILKVLASCLLEVLDISIR